MATRSETIKRVATTMAQQNGVTVKEYEKCCAAYEQQASAIVTMIEGKMLDFTWAPEA